MMSGHPNNTHKHHTMSSDSRCSLADASSSSALNESQPQYHQTPRNGFDSSNIDVYGVGGPFTTTRGVSSVTAGGSIGGRIGISNLNNYNVNQSSDSANANFSTTNYVNTSMANNGNQNSQSNIFYSPANGYTDGEENSNNNNKNDKNFVTNSCNLNSNMSNGSLNNIPNLSNHNLSNLANSFSRQRRGSGGMVQRAASKSDLLSKSVGTPSFLNRMGSRGNFQDSETPQPIRHAGYLHKRSNLPYVTSSIHGTDAPSNLAPLPDLSNTIIPLPIFNVNGLNESSCCDLAETGSTENITFVGANNSYDGGMGVGECGNMTTDKPLLQSLQRELLNTPIGASIDEEANPCLCSPLVQFFKNLIGDESSADAFISESKNDMESEYDSGLKTNGNTQSGTASTLIPFSNQNTIGGNRTLINYSIPLKVPATEPVPISTSGGAVSQPRRIENLGPRSVSEETRNLAENAAAISTPKNYEISVNEYSNNKKYPPPPDDYIDPRDGHIWRAKYCVLEDGILYFYRTALEGESDEAQSERNESKRVQPLTLEDSPRSDTGHLGAGTSSPRSSKIGVAIPTATQTTPSRIMSSSDRRVSQQDFHDLSMSPMPRKKSGLFEITTSPYQKSASTLSGGGAACQSNAPVLRHSGSTATFNHDADVLWEKRVALDCVGAVRSSELEYGKHAFELLAYGFDERIKGDDHSDASTPTNGIGGSMNRQQEVVDRLILRAGSSDDMNTWLFEFHQALFSFMKQLVDSVKNGDAIGKGNRAGQINHLGLRHRSDSPIVHNHNRHIQFPTNGSKCATNSSIVKQSSSPMSESFGASLGTSLSHGHGRNALYRRQIRDNLAGNVYVSPVSTPGGTPGGGSSPVDLHNRKLIIPLLPQSDVIKAGIQPSSITYPEGTCEIKQAPKKYVPPHLRKDAKQASKTYVPPHRRKKDKGPDANSTQVKQPLDDEKSQVPPQILRPRTNFNRATQSKIINDQMMQTAGAVSSIPSDGSLSESATSFGSSLLSRQMEEATDSSFSSVIQLGGCADPRVIGGSILDKHFIPRKASVVGKDKMEAFGGIGGGLFCNPRQETQLKHFDEINTKVKVSKEKGRSVLKWEVGAASECGIRNSNEDAYVAIANLEKFVAAQGRSSSEYNQSFPGSTQQGLYAIFDGHVGNHAARFSAERFPNILIEENTLYQRQNEANHTIEEGIQVVLQTTFSRLDREFCNLCTTDGRTWDSGSTALVALIVDDTVSLANLGDCRGVVCRQFSNQGGTVVSDMEGWEVLPNEHDRCHGSDESDERGHLYWREITETHSPLFCEERLRIETANGWIITETEIPTGQLHRMDFFDPDVVDIVQRCFGERFDRQHRSDPVRQIQIARTCGDLAVSRAIGDRDFKAAYNLPHGNMNDFDHSNIARSWEGPPVFIFPENHSGRFKGDIVSNVPDIKCFKVGQAGVVDEFLLMACDGLWDVMDGDDAVRIAKNLLFDKKMSAKDGASRLAELAKHLGSSDNITVILIRFYWEACAID